MQRKWLSQLEHPDYVWETKNPGATEQEIRELISFCHYQLPEDYVAFLHLSNGANLRYRDLWYLRIWSSSEVPLFSSSYGFVSQNIPGAIAFADDGEDEALVFDMRIQATEQSHPVVAVNLITVGWEETIDVAKSFQDLLFKQKHLLE